MFFCLESGRAIRLGLEGAVEVGGAIEDVGALEVVEAGHLLVEVHGFPNQDCAAEAPSDVVPLPTDEGEMMDVMLVGECKDGFKDFGYIQCMLLDQFLVG